MLHRLAIWVVLIGSAASIAHAQSIVTDDRRNKDWIVQGDTAVLQSSSSRRGPTLVIDAAAYANGSLTLTLETDSREIRLYSGARGVNIPLTEGASHTLMLTGGNSPSLQLNGTAVSTSVWPRIAGKSSMRIRFNGASRAKVSWQRSAAASTTNTNTTAVPIDDPFISNIPGSTASAYTPGESLVLQRARQGMVRLSIETTMPGVSLFARGMAIDSSGTIITRAHPLQHAQSIKAVFALDQTVNVHVIGLDAASDLAVLQLDPTVTAWRQAITPLETAATPPPPGTTLWQVGLSATGQFTLTQTSVLQMRLSERLPQAVQQQVVAKAGASWIITDAPVTNTAAGGPLLDNQGKFIGINIWLWPNQLKGGMASYHANWSTPQPATSTQVFTLDAVRSALANTTPPHTTFPQLISHAPQDVRRLQRLVNLANEKSPCPQCKGEGEFNVRVRVGYETGGAFRTPVYEEQAKPCRRCDGSGLNHPRVVSKLLADVAAEHTGHDPANTINHHAQTTLDAIGKRRTPQLMSLLNKQMDQGIKKKSLKVGQPFAIVGWMEKLKMPGKQDDVPIIVLTDRGAERIVFAPAAAGSNRSKTVLAGGRLAGYVVNASNQPVPVIERSFIVAVSPKDIPEISEQWEEDNLKSRTDRSSRYRSSRLRRGEEKTTIFQD